MTAVTPLLKVDGLRKTYTRPRSSAKPWQAREETVAVDDISFEVGSGETLAIVGQSGSGKSTAARCVMRLVSIDGGRIVFDGRDVTKIVGRELRRLRLDIQIVFQDPKRSFDPRMRLRTSLREPLRVHRIADGDRLTDVLEKVGLNERYLRKYPHELSLAGSCKANGDRARADRRAATSIVLDEPVSALDVSVQAQITTLLRDLQEETGVGYLFIAHDLAVVRELAHRVAVMRSGRILELRSTEELFAEPRDPYTRALLDASVVEGFTVGKEART